MTSWFCVLPQIEELKTEKDKLQDEMDRRETEVQCLQEKVCGCGCGADVRTLEFHYYINATMSLYSIIDSLLWFSLLVSANMSDFALTPKYAHKRQTINLLLLYNASWCTDEATYVPISCV